MNKKSIMVFTVLLAIQAGAVSFNSVSSVEVSKAECISLKPISETKMTDFINFKNKHINSFINAEFRGVKFKNENPELIELFKNIHNPYGPHLPEGMIQSLLSKLADTTCDKVICVMNQYYGEELTLRMLYIEAKFGLSTSPEGARVIDNFRLWTKSELDDVIVGLEAIPPNLLPITGRFLLHFIDGYTLKIYGDNPNTRVIANASFTFFDVWNKISRYDRIATVLHELGHFFGYDFADTLEWKSMPREYISGYAMTNNSEDFAESFAAYRLAPAKLRKISPARYNFIRDHIFHGLEFNVSTECEAPFIAEQNSIANTLDTRREIGVWAEQNQSEIGNQVLRQESMGGFKERAWLNCSRVYLNEVVGGTVEQTYECIKNTVKLRSVVVEMRKQNLNDELNVEIPLQKLNEIKVSKKMLHSIRQGLRQSAIEIFEKIFNEHLNFWSKEATCHQQVIYLTTISSDAAEVLQSAPEASASILNNLCSKKFSQSFWQGWFSEPAAEILP